MSRLDVRLWVVVLLVFVAVAVAGESGPVALEQAPALSNPSMTFKMERNAQDARGQEFIRLKGIDGVYKEPQADGTTKVVPQTFTIYQRVSSIDSVRFDTSDLTAAFETTRVTLLNGSWYVVTDSVEEVWKRLAEAGPYTFKPAIGEKE